MEKCNVCGGTNTEVVKHKIEAVCFADKVANFFTFGKVRHRICQTCLSKMFRKLDPNK